MYHSTLQGGKNLLLHKPSRSRVSTSWQSVLLPLSFVPTPSRYHVGVGRLIDSSTSSSHHGVLGLPRMQWTMTAASSLTLRRNPEYSGMVQRRNMSKDTMGLGIAVTRKKGKATGYCYGCGADLVKEGSRSGETTTVPKKKGYWADQKDFLKKAQIKNWALCHRCRRLRDLEEDAKNLDDATTRTLGPDGKMTEVFRAEVATIRTKERAVVVMCVDAINVSGTLIRTIRNYVGGNPILLAITRCDLLPDYVFETKTIDELKAYFRHRCREIYPAAVYLCSEDKEKMQQYGGIKELAADMWEHLNGRDPYVIGAANIGKSTLTDILIAGFINRGERLGHFRDKLAVSRVEKLREARITKSALPGTTLQNIRVPCFIDHHHALWDTPGLLLDESTAHFPIRNFRAIRAQRPLQIQPHIMKVDKKSFCLLITERDDDFPLIRFEVRLKKDDREEDGPVYLVWNSTLDLDTKIMEIKEAHEAEQDRFKRFILDAAPTPDEMQAHQRQLDAAQSENSEQTRPRTKEEKERHKEERRKAYLERIAQEKKEVGVEEWFRREEERKSKFFEEQRSKVLAKLVEVGQTVVDAKVGMDVAIANFGWIGFVCNRTAMIKTYAPSSGVRVMATPTMALPTTVGSYRLPKPQKSSEEERHKMKDRVDDVEGEDDDDEWMPDDDYVLNDVDLDYGDFAEGDIDYGGGLEYAGYEGYDPFGFEGTAAFEDEELEGSRRRRWYNPEEYEIKKDSTDDPWARYSGKNVGWQFDADMRHSKSLTRIEGWNPIWEDDPSKKKKEEEIDDIF